METFIQKNIFKFKFSAVKFCENIAFYGMKLFRKRLFLVRALFQNGTTFPGIDP